MICPKCRSLNQGSDNFCVKCGAPLTVPVQQPDVPLPSGGQPYPAGQQSVSQPPAGQPYPTSGQYSSTPQPPAEQQNSTSKQQIISPQTPVEQQYIPPVQRKSAPQSPEQPYTAAKKPPAQTAPPNPALKPQAKTVPLSPAIKPQAQPIPQKSYRIAEAAPSVPVSVNKPKKSKKIVVVIIVAVILVLLSAGTFLYVKYFRNNKALEGSDSAITTSQDAAVTAGTEDESATQTVDPTTSAVAPTEDGDPSQQGAAEDAFLELQGRWLDRTGVYEMYITPDGTFNLAMPEGLSSGTIVKSGTEYQLKTTDDSLSVNNSVITLNQEGNRPSIELRTEQTFVALDFESIPEKDESIDWFQLKPASETINLFPNYDEKIIDSDQESSQWMLIASYPMRNVKIQDLGLITGAQNGKTTYETQDRDSVSAILPCRPLMLQLSFTGDSSEKGISFVDINGKTRRFAFSYNENDHTVSCEEY